MFCLRYVKNEGLVQMSVFLFALCVDLFKTQVCVNAEEKNTGLNVLVCLAAPLNFQQKSLNAVFVSETRPNVYESTLPGTPPFPARAGPGTPSHLW